MLLLSSVDKRLMGETNRDLNLDPGKFLTEGFRSSSRNIFDIGQYYDIMNTLESPYYYIVF